MLGAAAAVLRGRAGAASTYVGRVVGHNPDWYLPLGDPLGIAQVGANGTYHNNPQLGVASIAQDDAGGACIGLSGATSSTPHITATSPLSAASFTIDMIVQLDDITKPKHVLLTHSGGLATGQVSIEVVTGGAVRCFSDDSLNAAHVIQSATGVVPQGDAVKITYQRQSNVPGWSQRAYVNGVLVAEDTTQRTWDAFAAGTVYIGTWWDGANFLDPTDGLIAHVAGWNSLLTPNQISSLVRPQSVAWAEDIDADAVQADTSKVISVRQGGWHGKTPFIATAEDGALVTTTESGEDITILAGSTTGTDDTFSYSFTDANGNSSPTKTVTIDVTEAAAGVSIGALTAFQPSRIQVTALSGWPAGRTPKEVVTQGTYAYGYARRPWKPTNNDGTWMDFQAGWRKTLSSGTVRIKLDNNSELDLSYTVNHTIPSPGSGGTTRTLDKLGGADFTSWTAAIAACQNNDVLVVRARAGGEVYPIDLNIGGANNTTANGVKVVAHPDDLAAGRRPRIHVQATKFAKFADELNAGHWVVDTDLGGAHGKVWKTAATIANPVNVGCSYRTTSGRLRRCYTYTNTPGTPGALARLRDKIYPRIAVPDAIDDPSEWDLYMGPGIYWHSTDQKLYIRLSPLRDGVGAIQVDKTAGLGPTPPWDWSDDNPESEDPNQCQLFISSSDQQNSTGNVSTNISYALRINGTSNWTLENLDFVGGGDTIQMRSGSGHTLRGCRILGWAPPNMAQDGANVSTIGQVHNMLECENSFNVTLDSCEFWGGACPWVGWDENKIRMGTYPAPQKCNLWWHTTAKIDSIAILSCSIRFVNCLCDGFLTVTRPGGRPQFVKFHQCRLKYWGMDGSIVCQTPDETLEYIRCQMFEFTFSGWSDQPATWGTQYVGYCLLTNFRPFMHENAWFDTAIPQGNQFVCGGAALSHGSNEEVERMYYYNNTSIGAHNHQVARVAKLTEGSGNMTHDGKCTSIFPHERGWNMVEWISRNNICAVRPNGSLGSCNGTTGGSSNDSHAGIVVHDNNMGRNLPSHTFSQDYNIYHRGAGMPAVGFTGAVTTLNGSGQENARNSITDVRNDTGQEQNGSIADPQFVGVWDATKLDTELHSNAQWCIPTGSPAASGGDTTDRTWPDMDFGTQVNYLGNSWRGCMDPEASAVEQQVGPLGPMPSEL